MRRTGAELPARPVVYQEILAETRPGLIVETGTANGGSALFVANVCDVFGYRHVATIDIADEERPQHPRLTYLHGSSNDLQLLEKVRLMAVGASRVIVVFDSDHARSSRARRTRDVRAARNPACCLVVKDTNVNEHPVLRGHGPGPTEALAELLTETDAFEVDRSREKFRMTFNPGGYLRRYQTERS